MNRLLAPLKSLGQALESLFHSDEAPRGRISGALHRSGQLLYLVGRKASADLVFERAASLSFTTTVSFVPLSLLVFSLFTSIGSNGLLSGAATEFRVAVEEFKERIVEYVAEDSRNDVREFLGRIERQVQRQAAGVQRLAILVLLIAVVSLLRSAERSFCAVWEVPVKRGYLRKLATFWLLLTLAPLILATSVYVRGTLESSFGLAGSALELPPGIAGPPLPPGSGVSGFDRVSWTVGGLLLHWIFPISISFFAFTLLFTYLPNTRVRLDAAALGGTVSALGWEIGAQGFSAYLDHAFLSGVYGALGIIPFFLFWVYFSWVVALTGALVSYCVQNFGVLVQEVRYRIVGQRISPPALALLFMERVYGSFCGRLPAATVDSLASLFHEAISKAEAVTRVLVEAGFLVEDSETVLSPRLAPDLVTPGEIVRCFPDGTVLGLPEAGPPTRLQDLVARVRAGVDAQLDRVRFSQLIERLPSDSPTVGEAEASDPPSSETEPG